MKVGKLFMRSNAVFLKKCFLLKETFKMQKCTKIQNFSPFIDALMSKKLYGGIQEQGLRKTYPIRYRKIKKTREYVNFFILIKVKN